MENKPIITCLLCGRNKFQRKTAHKCIGGYRKRKIKWQISYPEFTFSEWLNKLKIK